MDDFSSDQGDYAYPDHESGWGHAPAGQHKFMAWALILLILVLLAFGLVVRWTARPPDAARRAAPVSSGH